MSMQAYYLVFYPLPEKFWELLKPSYKKVLTSPVIDLFVTLLTDKHQFFLSLDKSEDLYYNTNRKLLRGDAYGYANFPREGYGIPLRAI